MPTSLHARIIGVQGLMGIAFLVFLVLTSNPFARPTRPLLKGAA